MGKPYSVPEAAKKLGVNVKTLYAAIRQGQVPSIKIGHRVLIPRAAFDRLLENGTPPAALTVVSPASMETDDGQD